MKKISTANQSQLQALLAKANSRILTSKRLK
jgi:hypothetical protein